MPETRYARSGDLDIAFQSIGEGSHDLVYVPGWTSNIEVMWEDPGLARFLRRLSSFSRRSSSSPSNESSLGSSGIRVSVSGCEQPVLFPRPAQSLHSA